MNWDAEWLEADGLGGFASGSVSTVRTRRYHGLLLIATSPPTARRMLVNGMDAWLDTPQGRVPLSSHRYQPDVLHPDGTSRIVDFRLDPWPQWTHRVASDIDVTLELFATPPFARTVLRWTLRGPAAGVSLHVRPLLSGRDYHALQRENDSFDFATDSSDEGLRWRPYRDSPSIVSITNGAWRADPVWFRQFVYAAERERGLDDTEDLASPGVLTWDLSTGPAVWVVGTEAGAGPLGHPRNIVATVEGLAEHERARRATLGGPLERAGDAYVVHRGIGKTLVAGYPWFTDWGRDTFIAMRGLCLATGRLTEARDILLEWGQTISEGMLPNRFPDASEQPEYNAVDASLWFIIAAHELLALARPPSPLLTSIDRLRLESSIITILEGYARGTRYGIRCDADGLLAAGVAGVQLTWMDARVGDRVITPRIGKPVEVQALWINALAAGAAVSSRWPSVLSQARASFETRFWNEAKSCLYDVVDADHVPDTVDQTVRPNQIFAVGGLPVALLTGTRARRVVDLVERELWTPLGLRSLAPDEPAYVRQYTGGPSERDAAYHQGTAWPWLLGAFVEAWVNVRGGTVDARRAARERFITPLLEHLDHAGLGHVSEIADADAPHTPRGCPFQAWSLGELIRVERLLQSH